VIPGYRVRRALGRNLTCEHPRHDPSFPYWVCPDCGSQVISEAIELQAGFDRAAFWDAVSKDSSARIEAEVKARLHYTADAGDEKRG
jgi:hypothetical protein